MANEQKSPAPAAPVKPQAPIPAAETAAPAPTKAGLSEARQSVLAQHWHNTPKEKQPGLLAHVRESGTAEEKAFFERLAGTLN